MTDSERALFPRLLPSWLKLYQSTPNPSDDETKQVLQESELLMSNLGTEPLRKTNVLLDHDTVRLLGILQESLVSYTVRPSPSRC